MHAFIYIYIYIYIYILYEFKVNLKDMNYEKHKKKVDVIFKKQTLK